MQKISIIIILTLTVFIFPKNLIQVSNRSLDNIELLDIYVHGDLAFVPGGLGGLNILNISDPENIQVLSEYSASGCDFGRIYAWAVSGNFAYGTGRECGVKIIDISDITEPTTTGDFGTNGFRYEHPVIMNNLLFLSRHQAGIELVDITLPQTPISLAEIWTTNAWASIPDGNFLYVADGSGGLRVININTPTNPTTHAILPTSGSARDIDKIGNFIFVAVGAAGVDMIDVSDPSNPIFLDNFNTTGFASRVDANDSLIAVSDWDDVEVLHYDESGLSLAGYKNNGTRVMAAALVENHIFSAEWMRFSVYEFGEVQGADLDMETHRIEFSRTHTNETQTKSITLENNGTTTLTVEDIQSGNPNFSYALNNSSIFPGETSILSVTYAPNSGGWQESILIQSNDISLPAQSLKSLGNFPYGPMPGDPAPGFELPLVNGNGTLGLNDLLGAPSVIAFFTAW